MGITREPAMGANRAPHLIGVMLLALLLATGVRPVDAASLEAQRKLFKATWPAAELGQREALDAARSTLEDYVLWPDLQAAYLRAHLDDDAAVRQFLEAFSPLRPARTTRYRYALRLARRGRHTDFLTIYDEHYAGLDDPRLDCLAAHARIKSGATDAALSLARGLWLVGHSQVKECDPVFDHMREAGQLTASLLHERYALAIARYDFPLARYIARSIGKAELEEANRWLRAKADPAIFLRTANGARSNAVYRRQLAYAAERLARRQPQLAYEEWARLDRDMSFEQPLAHAVARAVALWSARRQIKDADEMLASLPAAAMDDEVRRWQIRESLANLDWARVIATIDALSDIERAAEEWQYWKAEALDRVGRRAEAMLVFSTLARQRSYYGFLAADQLGSDYAFSSAEIIADDDLIEALAARPGMLRARELFRVGLDGKARAEWNAAVSTLSSREKAQAALLAQRWNWHSRAIALAAQAGEYDSLGIRYPLPHRDEFRASAQSAGIPESWAYGIARSESIFMRDVRSSAGAIGLMQLMPATGRSTAQALKLPYRGIKTLVDPRSNIELGTSYLARMHARFNRHPALATAAYNAGPHRVARWLPESTAVDARIWVETIPFKETREYVRRVLMSDIIFEWRLGGDVRRLSERLPAVAPRQPLRTAANQPQ